MQGDDIPQVPMVKEPTPERDSGFFPSSPHQKVTVIGIAVADKTNEAGEGKKRGGHNEKRCHRQPLHLFNDDKEKRLTLPQVPPPS